MTNKFGNAIVLMQSKKGSYGSIGILGRPEEEIKVCYLVICKYSDDNGSVYMLLCDEEMNEEQDVLFDNIEEALLDAQRRTKGQIEWEYTNENQ